MKTKSASLMLCAMFFIAHTHAQVTVPSNSCVAGDYVGCDIGTTIDLDIEHKANFPIHFRTNSFERMMINNGLNNNTDGRIGIGNDLVGFTPQSRLHLHENAITGGNTIRFSCTNTGLTGTDGYSIGINNQFGYAFHTQLEAQSIQFWLPQTGTSTAWQEWLRIQHGNLTSPFTAGTATNGYIGLNEPAPFFHIEQKTPFYPGGELFIGAHPGDVANSRMGMLNGAQADNFFRPTLFGKLDATQTDPALQTLAVIDPSQDIATNAAAQRFLVAMNWNYNQGGIQNMAVIRNRPAFSWQNANNVKMWMNADGRMRLGDNLNTSTPQVARMEITAHSSDVLGSQIGTNGASGLRFTHLTSLKTPYATNPGPGVLSVDVNGDVIYVPAGSSGVNLCLGIPVNNVTKNIGGNTLCSTNIYDLPANQVGVNTNAPNDAFEVGTALGGNGNIDVSNGTSSYKLGNTPILWHKGIITNLYVGALAGNNAAGGADNTIVGHNAAGQNTILGQSNTVVGSEAAYTMASAQASTYIGHRAGYNSGGSNNNTYVGAGAGENGAPGADENVLVGWHAGQNIAGLHNVCIGNNSGISNAGYQNTFVGIGSGPNSTGANNVALGATANMGNPAISNSSAIGAGSSTMVSNTMILGDNNANVGIGLSGDLTGPLNKLEINTTTGSPYFGSPNGSSGLRFRNMTSADVPQVTLFNGVLSVDANGDVILVQDKTGAGASLGDYCINFPASLLGDYEIPLGSSDFHFTADNALQNKVNIGIPCGTTAPGKFNVNTAVPSDPNNPANSFTIYATNTNGGSATTNTGVYGSADNYAVIGAGNGVERGVWGYASGENDARGVFGQGGRAMNSHGGYFEALDPSSNTNYGVYAEARSGTINYGIYATVGGTSYLGFGPDWAGYFDGDVYTTTGYYPSDKNLKKSIETMDNALNVINKLNPVTYHYDVESNKELNLPGSKQYGFISQEVKEILPELTKIATPPSRRDQEGNEISPKKEILALNYNGFIAILAKGVQEQQALIEKQNESIKQQQRQIEELKTLVTAAINTKNNEIQELESKLAVFENDLNACCQSTASKAGSTDRHSNINTASTLKQNVPNPTNGETIIGYNIAGTFNRAFIGIYDLNGREVKKIQLYSDTYQIRIEKGLLTPGQYVYSLVIDNHLIDSKKMIVIE